ncbi:hypothetical protein [Orrella marina]|uniref:Transmembrane protein n=1 Tax=Orrella marina TaxID=2163011 RepID=A0A2R4XGY2_9BURK|nr:hypothetical protein [Orrella marina]AWB33088.1 hypothetical protein DBV39_04445 [Orrella marina]
MTSNTHPPSETDRPDDADSRPPQTSSLQSDTTLPPDQWRRFKELLPFYVNGSLDRPRGPKVPFSQHNQASPEAELPNESPEKLPENPSVTSGDAHNLDRLFVEQCLQVDPAARQWLAFCTHLQDVVQSHPRERTQAEPDRQTSTPRPDSVSPPTAARQAETLAPGRDLVDEHLRERTDRLLLRWRALQHGEDTRSDGRAAIQNETLQQDTVADRTPTRPATRSQMKQRLTRNAGFANWWPALFGAGFVTAALVLATIGPFANVMLHHDDWNGNPDIELVLAQGVTPEHETVLAHLDNYQGKVLNHRLEDDRYRVSVDLRNRSHNQRPLIDALKADGHLEDYVLLANR